MLVTGRTSIPGALRIKARRPASRKGRIAPVFERVPSGKITTLKPSRWARWPSSSIAAMACSGFLRSMHAEPPRLRLNETPGTPFASSRFET